MEHSLHRFELVLTSDDATRDLLNSLLFVLRHLNKNTHPTRGEICLITWQI